MQVATAQLATAKTVAATAGSHFWPERRDPRIPFAALLTLYGVLGFSFLGFNRSPAQMGIVVGFACALDLVLTRVLRGRWVLPLSAYISGCSLALLLNYAHATWLLVVPVYFAIASKHLITFQGRHVYNPSLFGVVISLIASGELITAAPAYQWAGGDVTLSAFLVMAALTLFVLRIQKGALIVSFLLLYAAQTALRAYVMRHHLPWQTLFYGTLGAPPFLLFVFYMMTDPATSPRTVRGQLVLAFALTAVDLWLHTRESVFTYWYAGFICQTARLLFSHGRELWRSRGGALRGAISPPALRRAAAVVVPGALIATAAAVLVPRGTLGRPLDFHLERVPAAAAGLSNPPSDLLERTDPRLHHVAKWILSVGDSVAVGDYDGDGRTDLFLAGPLKQ
ncbi:MAG TPA: RnfABCDGE type electron transport complex subunit D, partial [Myxococcales bacterium]|nr:RnfABCDGE type electron transport complex subunit D [Myxococcales bacterium]